MLRNFARRTVASLYMTRQPGWLASACRCPGRIVWQSAGWGSVAGFSCTTSPPVFSTSGTPLRSTTSPRAAGTGVIRTWFWTAATAAWSECSTWSAQSRNSSTPNRPSTTRPSAVARSASGSRSGSGSGLGGGDSRYIGSADGRSEHAAEERREQEGDEPGRDDGRDDLATQQVAERELRAEQLVQHGVGDLHHGGAHDRPQHEAARDRRRLEAGVRGRPAGPAVDQDGRDHVQERERPEP